MILPVRFPPNPFFAGFVEALSLLSANVLGDWLPYTCDDCSVTRSSAYSVRLQKCCSIQTRPVRVNGL